MKILKYKIFTNNKIDMATDYKEDLLCKFINENRIEQKDIQKIYVSDYYIELYYWEE